MPNNGSCSEMKIAVFPSSIILDLLFSASFANALLVTCQHWVRLGVVIAAPHPVVDPGRIIRRGWAYVRVWVLSFEACICRRCQVTSCHDETFTGKREASLDEGVVGSFESALLQPRSRLCTRI